MPNFINFKAEVLKKCIKTDSIRNIIFGGIRNRNLCTSFSLFEMLCIKKHF